MVSLHHTFNILKRHFSEWTFYNTTVSICSYYILFEGYHFFSFTYLGHFSISQEELDTEKQRIKNRYREADADNIKGFAFVIGIYGPAGTKADVDLVSSTFEDDLNFTVDRRMDQTCEELACLIKAASAPEMTYPLSCKCIAFYFAGHGGIDESGKPFILPMQKDKDVVERFYIEENILSFFRPFSDLVYKKKTKKECIHLFFFDSCLSDATTCVSSQSAVSLVPSPGFVIAHATYPGERASGNSEGGVWTRYLCKNLKLQLPITDILALTHDDVKKEGGGVQLPYQTSCVGKVFLKGINII